MLARCDAADGIKDGIIEPPFCKFDRRTDLPVCSSRSDREDCLTLRQIESVEQIYDGVRNSSGELLYPGVPVGTECQWPRLLIPTPAMASFPTRCAPAPHWPKPSIGTIPGCRSPVPFCPTEKVGLVGV